MTTRRKPELPPECPLPMTRQRLHADRRPLRAGAQTLTRRVGTAFARLALLASIASVTGFGVWEMYAVISGGGVTLLQWLFLAAFSLSFLWIAISACQAVTGFVRMVGIDLFGGWRTPKPPADIRTAILLPIYNEDPVQIAAGIRAMAAGLHDRAPGRFAFFLLSDTNRPQAWIAEEAMFASVIQAAPDGCPVYYRHRRRNTERKAGNIAEWVARWGGGYEAMIVLDADSLIDPATMIEMARRIDANPALGLIQTLPAIVGGRTLFARLQQFANRCYGPVFGNGLAAWHGVGSNFWGHNAIIRTRAFAAWASLPILPGAPPSGGHVLSHDFIEAAMLRRGGWGVRFDTDLRNSFEEAPPSLIDVMVRDRRWCQGNLQHIAFLTARGIPFASRLHLFTGILGYLSAPLWLLLVATGLMLAVQVALSNPEYFAGPSLFPIWPVFDSERAIRLFLISMGVLLTPKLLGWAAIILHPRRCLAFGGPVFATLGVVVEIFLSALYAPVMMIAQSHIVWQVLRGGDSGWKPQRRDDGGVPFETAMASHRWHSVFGVVLAWAAWAINPGLFLWTLPVTGALILAPVTSWLSGSRTAGRLLYRLGMLRTPEERRRSRPEILDRRAAELAALMAEKRPEVVSALVTLSEDAELNAWHCRQLENRSAIAASSGFDADLAVAEAKAQRESDPERLSAWLTAPEEIAFLHDSGLVANLLAHGQKWRRA